MADDVSINPGDAQPTNVTVRTDELSGGGHVQYVKLMNGTADSESVFKCDTTTSSMQTVEYEHHEIHSGSSYRTSYIVELSNGASQDILVTTPDTTKWAHMTLLVNTKLEAAVYIYENPTITGAGTGVTTYNRNRNVSTAATTVVTHTPSVSATGAVLIWADHVGTGKSSGSESHSQDEFVLKQNEQYLIRVTNATSSANYVAIHVDWYEHTNN